ncbi:short-chain dehydrogenase [Histoplasma capsulatum]|uniref:Short-chain dehydrogenase n=1 Tax=Ajellomyces capsulatus TaxID=5037 RepID=A0A8A1M5M6_AJECA|nr:short-chain dehydrogenase [Histoplasma capsulatum]
MSSKTIIITGSSRGIGLAVAHYLLRLPASHNLILLARSRQPLQQLQEQYGPNRVEILTGDFATSYYSSPSLLSLPEQAVEVALKQFGRLDGLVLNHGTLGPVRRLVDCELSEWRDGIEVNFLSVLGFLKAAIPHLRKTRGKVVFTSSGAATSATTGWGLYGSSKAALNHLNMTMALEEPDITSISIRPGMVDTKMQEELRAQHIDVLGPVQGKRFLDAHREGKLLKPEQPGHVIAKLVLDAPRDLSGKFLTWNCPELAAFQE